ncbi:MAG TPA: flagellar biosynthesis protein FlgE [Desulfosporosinus sp.]|nr:flagellar biosynthesis protein FlgE [Desulfosporosinus sp.]
MMRSLYSAISGLKNHQVKMDVIGDNVANVNTLGFKRSRANFSTMLSQTMKGASSPSATQGGTNAIQVGLGAVLGSIDKIMTQGSAQSTGKDTDLMLQGPGFFVMDNGGQIVYTRAGGFGFDRDGYLEDPSTGARVQGYSWGADDSTKVNWTGPGYGAIKFSLGDSLPQDKNMPIKPEKIQLNATVDNWDDDITYTYTDSDTQTTMQGDKLIGAGVLTIDGMTRVESSPKAGQFTFDPESGTITFSEGYQRPTDGASGTVMSISYVAASNPLTVDANNPNKITVDHMPSSGAKIYASNGTDTSVYTMAPSLAEVNDSPNYYWAENTNGKYTITFSNHENAPTPPTEDDNIGYDFLNLPRTLTSFSIDQTGIITGVYSDGNTSATQKIAQIAIAKFSNDAGLNKLGGNFYSTTNNSGDADIGSAAEDGRALIVPGAVEMSNVDLSQEFTDMIVTQRGFQANSRVITVSDSLLQELIDLKRN